MQFLRLTHRKLVDTFSALLGFLNKKLRVLSFGKFPLQVHELFFLVYNIIVSVENIGFYRSGNRD